jgi:Lon protease-like protein
MYNQPMSFRLPLFPLNTVLFPSQLLPLHIFEHRYRQMVADCLAAQLSFGVASIRTGQEVGSIATPYTIGMTAKIVQSDTLPDGRLNILCVGDARFKILEIHTDQPYLSGTIDLWPWQPVQARTVQSSMERIRTRLNRYLQLLSKLISSPLQIDLPDEPANLANLAAAVLQIEANEKQTLLSTISIDELLNRVDLLLAREVRGMQLLQAAEYLRPRDESISFSQN